MIEILFLALSAKQPSNPPPTPPPARIEAVVPKELEFVNEKDERVLKENEADTKVCPPMRKMAKIPRAKRQVNRRGMRNH